MVDVPDDVIDAFMAAFYRADGGLIDTVRAALAAVIPMIEARERETCAEIAENEYLAATNDDEDEGNNDIVARFKSQGAADGASRIRAAIRARGAA